MRLSTAIWMTTTLLLALLTAIPALAGGAWVAEKGDGDVHLGFSRKTANTSWDDQGHSFRNTGRVENHDFRYTYLSGEIGLSERFSATFLVTWLDGREGPTGNLTQNVGFSDSWFGVKYQVREGAWPIALEATLRTDILYGIDGPYTRELFDDEGHFVGESPEWRGILKEDYTLAAHLSHSFRGGRDWGTVSVGYTFREGAPADQVPVVVEGGSWLTPGRRVALKAHLLLVRSLGNDSPRQPDDRFGSRPGFNFNDASMGRAGISIILPLGRDRKWAVEAGYNQWLWGRSARQYEEPFVSVGRSF